MESKNSPPLVRIERQWLEAVEELHKISPNKYCELITVAIGKAAGIDKYNSITGFADETIKPYWELTSITPKSGKGTIIPGTIEMKKNHVG